MNLSLAALPPMTGRRAPRAATHGLAVFSIAILSIAPWVVYNVGRFQEPVFISSNLGGILCGSYNAKTFGSGELGLWDRGACPLPASRPADQSVLSDFWTTESLDFLQDNVERLPLVAIARVGRWTGIYAPNQNAEFEEATGGRPAFASWLALFAFVVLLPLSLVGVVTMRRRRVPLTPLLVPIAISLVVAIAFYGEVRYRVGADVSVVVLAALGLHTLFDRGRAATGP